MRILFRADVCGWRMTGLLGRDGAWFFGFSKKPPATTANTDEGKQ